MRKRFPLLVLIVAVSGCAGLREGLFGPRGAPAPGAQAPQDTAQAPAPVAEAAPPEGATTVEALDVTTAEERERARKQAAPAAGETLLGTTIASLGAVTEPGIWLKTPLVKAPAKGRVEYPEKGTAVAVDLIPLDAEPGAGSRLSLSAMRLLEADLTALPELRVYRLN